MTEIKHKYCFMMVINFNSHHNYTDRGCLIWSPLHMLMKIAHNITLVLVNIFAMKFSGFAYCIVPRRFKLSVF